MEKPKISPFPDEILEYIAGIISETRSGSEITRFFKAAGYPEFVHDRSTKKWFVLDCLRALNNRSDGPYHVVKIIEKLADPKQYINTPEVHRKILEGLNRSLIFHGLQINKDNRAVLSKKTAPSTPQDIPSDKVEIDLFKNLCLHPKIREVSEKLFIDGHYAQAIFEAFKTVNNAVKEKSGLRDRDGKSLMASAFSGNPPPLALNSLQTQSEKDEQEGFKLLFMGAMAGIRNPRAHDHVRQTDSYRTLHYLAFASLLMARIDESIRTGKWINIASD